MFSYRDTGVLSATAYGDREMFGRPADPTRSEQWRLQGPFAGGVKLSIWPMDGFEKPYTKCVLQVEYSYRGGEIGSLCLHSRRASESRELQSAFPLFPQRAALSLSRMSERLHGWLERLVARAEAGQHSTYFADLLGEILSSCDLKEAHRAVLVAHVQQHGAAITYWRETPARRKRKAEAEEAEAEEEEAEGEK